MSVLKVKLYPVLYITGLYSLQDKLGLAFGYEAVPMREWLQL